MLPTNPHFVQFPFNRSAFLLQPNIEEVADKSHNLTDQTFRTYLLSLCSEKCKKEQWKFPKMGNLKKSQAL